MGEGRGDYIWMRSRREEDMTIDLKRKRRSQSLLLVAGLEKTKKYTKDFVKIYQNILLVWAGHTVPPSSITVKSSLGVRLYIYMKHTFFTFFISKRNDINLYICLYIYVDFTINCIFSLYSIDFHSNSMCIYLINPNCW